MNVAPKSWQFSLRQLFAFVTVLCGGLALARIHEELPLFVFGACAVAFAVAGGLLRQRGVLLLGVGGILGFLLTGFLSPSVLRFVLGDLATPSATRTSMERIAMRHTAVCYAYFLATLVGGASAYWLGHGRARGNCRAKPAD